GSCAGPDRRRDRRDTDDSKFARKRRTVMGRKKPETPEPSVHYHIWRELCERFLHFVVALPRRKLICNPIGSMTGVSPAIAHPPAVSHLPRLLGNVQHCTGVPDHA